jgi:sugar lactone lactonase YvrE
MQSLLLAFALVSQSIWVAPEGPGYPESLIVEPDGSIMLSVVFSGKVFLRKANGEVLTVAQLPDMAHGQPGFICIVRAEDGKVYATASRHRGEVWRLDESGGEPVLVASLPDGAQPNGITTDGHGGLILGDNLGGLWQVDPYSGSAKRWLEHVSVSRNSGGRYPAANGVQRVGDTLYVANSDRALFISIKIGADGSPGRVRTVAANVPGDDFAVDPRGNAYVTTHPNNSVIKVDRHGRTQLFADLAAGMHGPTAAAMASVDGKQWLYVAVDGGTFTNGGEPQSPPAVVRIALPAN